MQKFFINEVDFNSFSLPADISYQVLKVLRYQVGSTFIVGVNEDNYLVRINNIKDKLVFYEILEKLNINNELDLHITIIQGYPKGDKIEDIIKTSTQLGASAFIPCLMQRTQFKIDKDRQKNKIIRFNKISKEASEQSMRNVVPVVCDFKNLKDIDFNEYKTVFVCYEETAKQGDFIGFKDNIKSLKANDHIAILIGPEGGISEEEIIYLRQLHNVRLISLGKRILRTEVASAYALSAISYERELK